MIIKSPPFSSFGSTTHVEILNFDSVMVALSLLLSTSITGVGRRDSQWVKNG